MLEKNIREQIIELMHQQVVPAVGCTEPMAVALCTARATELLWWVSQNISWRLLRISHQRLWRLVKCSSVRIGLMSN